jgi:mannose-6-phosphate isomerase-like protein (cupin superfamily)
MKDAPFQLSRARVHLDDGPGAQALEATADFWERIGTDDALAKGRIVSAFFVRRPDDVHPAQWEMHPAGDELLYLCSGAIDLVLEEADGERTVALGSDSAYLIPAGVWHRLLLREPGLLMVITRHDGTRLRDV